MGCFKISSGDSGAVDCLLHSTVRWQDWPSNRCGLSLWRMGGVRFTQHMRDHKSIDFVLLVGNIVMRMLYWTWLGRRASLPELVQGHQRSQTSRWHPRGRKGAKRRWCCQGQWAGVCLGVRLWQVWRFVRKPKDKLSTPALCVEVAQVRAHRSYLFQTSNFQKTILLFTYFLSS